MLEPGRIQSLALLTPRSVRSYINLFDPKFFNRENTYFAGLLRGLEIIYIKHLASHPTILPAIPGVHTEVVEALKLAKRNGASLRGSTSARKVIVVPVLVTATACYGCYMKNE